MGVIRLYQLVISPFLPAACRFTPTCSQYAYEAFHRFGTFKGFYLSVRRVVRCQPFCKGGVDPVPESFHFFGR